MTVTQLDPTVSASPQIRRDDLAGLKAMGFRCIVNNRPDEEEEGQPSSAELEAEAERLGLLYRYIPIVPGQMSDADALAFARCVDEAGGPVLAFCRSGARSTNLWRRSRQLLGLDD